MPYIGGVMPLSPYTMGDKASAVGPCTNSSAALDTLARRRDHPGLYSSSTMARDEPRVEMVPLRT